MKTWHLAIAVLGGALALLVLGGVTFARLVGETPTELRNETPFSIAVGKPTQFTVWYYTDTVRDGQSIRQDEPPAGISVRVSRDGQEVPVQISRGMTVSSGAGQRESLLAISANERGTYRVTLTGAPPDASIVLTVGNPLVDLLSVFSFGGGGILLLILGIIWIAVALEKERSPKLSSPSDT